MPTITIGPLRAADGTPVDAVRFLPLRRADLGAGAVLVTYDGALVAELTDGAGTAELLPTEDGTGPVAWRAEEIIGEAVHHVQPALLVADVDTVYADLAPVDPDTLDPEAEPEAAWWVALDQLADVVDDIDGGGGGGATDLSVTRNATTVTVESSTGDDATIPAANGSNAGAMTAAHVGTLGTAASTAATALTDAATAQSTATAAASAAATAQSTADSKAAAVHTHAQSDVTGLASALAGKAPTSHTHAVADTTGLQTALDGKSATGHGHAQSDVTGLVTALAGKAATSHTHAIADTTGLQAAIDGKAATVHAHAQSDVTGLTAALAALTPGTWVALLDGTSNAKFTSTINAQPMYRLNGDRIEFKGRLTVGGGSGVASAEVIATLPVGMRPLTTRRAWSSASSGALAVQLVTSGQFQIGASGPTVINIDLDPAFFFI